MLHVAFKIARTAHAGQLDKGGNPYIDHPVEVMRMVGRMWNNDPEMMAIAVLHDVVEDSETTLDDLRAAGLSERIVSGVDAMSRRDGETNKSYFGRVMRNRDAAKVKIADLTHNMDSDRIGDLANTPEWTSKFKWMRNLRCCLISYLATGVPHWTSSRGIVPRPDMAL